MPSAALHASTFARRQLLAAPLLSTEIARTGAAPEFRQFLPTLSPELSPSAPRFLRVIQKVPLAERSIQRQTHHNSYPLSMRDDLSTVTLSGTLVNDAQSYMLQDMHVTHLDILVQGAGDDGAAARFKVVAFDERAEDSQGLKAGDRVVLVGPLRQKRDDRGHLVVEVKANVLIKMRPELLDHAAKE